MLQGLKSFTSDLNYLYTSNKKGIESVNNGLS